MGIESLLDRDGFIRPHLSWQDASNDGVVLSVVAGLLGVLPPDAVDRAVYACVTSSSLPVLMRRPDNSGPNQSHDGWSAIATWCLYRKNVKLAWRLLVSYTIRMGYVKNAPFELGGKTWQEKIKELLAPALIRFPKIWVTLIAAALPRSIVYWICGQTLQLLSSCSSPNLSDVSGLQLTWLDLYAVMLMGNRSPIFTFLAKIRSSGITFADLAERDLWDASTGVPDAYRMFEAGAEP